jgi:hypothetical protein
MVDWNGHLGYQDATGIYAARFDFDPDTGSKSYVRVLVFGEPFKSVWNPNWRKTLKFNEATGECVSSGY